MKAPKFSICIPCYNQGAYLEAAILSCLSQSYGNIEIIVSNNASTDTTADVMASLGKDRRLKTLHQPRTLPMTEHWNIFASHVTGDWVMLLCADDILHEHAIANCQRAASEHDRISAVFFEYDYLNGTQAIKKTPFYRSSATIPAAQQFKIFLKGNNFPLSAGIVRRDIIDQLGWFNVNYRFCPDWYLWTAVTAGYPSSDIAYIKDKLLLYRQHDENETLHCIAKRQTIPEIARMKHHFITHYIPEPEIKVHTEAAQRGTHKLAQRYAEIARSHSDDELASYYISLAGDSMPPRSEDAAPTPPYALPEGSTTISTTTRTERVH